MTGEPSITEFESELNPQQLDLIHRFATWIVRRRMTTPAILFLESVRPMNYVGSQVMVFFQPTVQAFFKVPEWDEIRRILEKRESVGYLVDLIELKEADVLIEEKEKKEARKLEKNQKNSWLKRLFCVIKGCTKK